MIIALFAGGLAIAVFAYQANKTQHGYYAAAREVKRGLEERLHLGDHALTTTPGMGSKLSRLGKVQTFQSFMLLVLGAASAIGLGATVADAAGTFDEDPPGAVVVQLQAAATSKNPEPRVVVLSENGDDKRVKAVLRIAPGGTADARVEPGTYQLSTLERGKVCERELRVEAQPLQRLVLKCR